MGIFMYKIVVISGMIISAICAVLITITIINIIGIEMFILITLFIVVMSFLYGKINEL